MCQFKLIIALDLNRVGYSLTLDKEVSFSPPSSIFNGQLSTNTYYKFHNLAEILDEPSIMASNDEIELVDMSQSTTPSSTVSGRQSQSSDTFSESSIEPAVSSTLDNDDDDVDENPTEDSHSDPYSRGGCPACSLAIKNINLDEHMASNHSRWVNYTAWRLQRDEETSKKVPEISS